MNQLNEHSEHRLIFGDAWDRTISTHDREQMMLLVNRSPIPIEEFIRFLPFRSAYNYKGDLLVTVIVQNFTTNDFVLEDFTLQLKVNQEVIAQETFTVEYVVIKTNSSSPWTFIFPNEKVVKNEQVKRTDMISSEWHLEIIDQNWVK